MNWLSTFLFGKIEFSESEELLEFRYKCLILMQIFTSLTSSLYVALAELGAIEHFSEIFARIILVFAILMFVFLLILRERKSTFFPIAYLTVIISVSDTILAFMLVDNDEVRILWMVVGIPYTLLVLGLRSGTVITLLSIVSILLLNSQVAQPLSLNALATTVMAMLFQTVFYYAYNNRLISYFTRMRESNAQLRDLAARDMLTNVLNARTYYEICDSQIQVAKRQRMPYAVLFIDLDHFKSINDTYGHAAGDIVLKSVADCLSGSLRASDALGRVGGEEFSVFLMNTDGEGAMTLAESIRQNIESLTPSTGDQSVKITASIGVARSSHEEQTMLEIQKRADQAMYDAKASGRNRVSSLEGVV